MGTLGSGTFLVSTHTCPLSPVHGNTIPGEGRGEDRSFKRPVLVAHPAAGGGEAGMWHRLSGSKTLWLGSCVAVVQAC